MKALRRKKSRKRTVKCVICEASFKTNHSQGKYCSRKCKTEGVRASWRKYSAGNRSRRRAYSQAHYQANKQAYMERIEAYLRTPRGKMVRRKIDARQRAKYPEKYAARQAVLVALRKGTLTKTPCECCGAEKVEAHHDDYDKPLTVKWLCRKCHRVLHEALKYANK